MLALSRYVGETILIGPDIRIKVLAIDDRGKVRLGIEAPRDVMILRGELLREQREDDLRRLEERAG